jgi:hypothetical protein
LSDRARPLLAVTAIVYLAAGIALIFASEELLGAAGATGTPFERGAAQLLGAALFGFGMFNWMQRHSRIGGIYGRPLVVANFSHAVIAAPALVAIGRETGFSTPLAIAAAAYGLLALLYGRVLLARAPAPGPAND